MNRLEQLCSDIIRLCASVKAIDYGDDLDAPSLGSLEHQARALLAPNTCGHPMGMLEDNPDPLSHLDSFYREQIRKGMLNDGQVSSLMVRTRCSLCAEIEQAIDEALKKVSEGRRMRHEA